MSTPGSTTTSARGSPRPRRETARPGTPSSSASPGSSGRSPARSGSPTRTPPTSCRPPGCACSTTSTASTSPQRLGSWLATTARHESLHTLRRSSREPVLDVVQIMDPVPRPAAAGRTTRSCARARHCAVVAVRAAVRRLPALLRVMIATAAPSYAEIAAALDMPVGQHRPDPRPLPRHAAQARRRGRHRTGSGVTTWHR